ncbi:MAG: 4Fe-4S ferredoxin [Actinomycetota bacterium]|nr:4Fe-4S ferredoxin [Actinomycetota bacterium]
MVESLIIGSGPAAAGAALALAADPRQQITVLDLGQRLEPAQQAVLARVAAADPPQWSEADVAAIQAQPVAQVRGELPQKRSYGSDYPFRDQGQLIGISATAGANRSVVSAAFGGFSNVWGAQVMPFSRATFDRWPLSWAQMEPHYRAVLQEVPLAADEDELEESFPRLVTAQPLPPLAARSVDVLRRYERHRARLRRQGVLVARARLAMHARDCVRCGLCMTGCPYSLIYSAAHTFQRLRASGRIRYHEGLLVHRIAQVGEVVSVSARDVRTQTGHEFRGDRLFVACGGLGTTRLVLGSLPDAPAQVELAESVQFVVPFLSARPVADPRTQSDFTLNQFNILLDLGDNDYDLSQIHCYPYNPAFSAALPGVLRHPVTSALTTQVLRRLTAGLGYLPSWASPRISVTHCRRSGADLPEMSLSPVSTQRPPMYGRVLRRLVLAAPWLDLWPLLGRTQLSGAAKSYHFGASFGHAAAGRATPWSTDLLGRLGGWTRIHLVDGSVFPSVPATTFTLTVMANAHRIASETMAESPA